MNEFSDRNFYNLPTNENFCTPCEFHKNRKNVKISEIRYGMSSYWDEFLRLQMGSLGVLDVFCTVFECATTSRSKFKILSIFAIFRFLISGFWQFDHRNFDDFSFVGSKIFFSKSIIIKLFHINYVAVSMHYFVPYSHFGVFPQFSIYRLVGEFSFVGIL